MKLFNTATLLTLGLALTSNAATVVFDNDNGNRLWSEPTNWFTVSGPVDTLPTAADNAFIGAGTGLTASNPTLIDPSWSLVGGNATFQGSNGYGLIQSGATLRPNNLVLGANNAAASQGSLTVANGGTLVAQSQAGGAFVVGGTGTQSAGTLSVEAGANVNVLPNLTVNSLGTLQFTSNATGFGSTQMGLYGNSSWLMDGKLVLDFTNLSSDLISTILIDQNNASPVSMTGALRTWLDTGSGTQSSIGSGVFGSGVLEIQGLSSGDTWSLTYDDTNKELSVSVIPEPSSAGLLMGSALAIWMIFVRRR